MIPIFCPSKNRACQLDLLLRSFEINAPGLFSPTIMYNYTGSEFKDGYEKLMNSNAGKKCDWHNEGNAEEIFYGFMKNNNGVIGLFTDDCIFYKSTETTVEDINEIMEDQSVWNFNFRMGRNSTLQDYVTGRCVTVPDHKVIKNKFMKWNFRQYKGMWESNFGFENAFDGYFYRNEDLLWISDGGHFDKIILFEGMICKNGRRDLHNKKNMVSPLHSEVVVQQINSTHHYGFHTSGYFNKSLQELNTEYLNGNIIDLDSMDFSNVHGAHAEIKFEMRKELSL